MPWSPEPADQRPVVLVEGDSDLAAIEVLASRHHVHLDHVEVVSMAGITNLPAHLARLVGGARDVALLYDAAEIRYVDRVLIGDPDVDRFGCADDLEHELLRALGVTAVESLIEGQGELASLRLLQRQPAQRDRTPMQHLRRFLSSHSGRKLRYARLLGNAVPLEATPAPLMGLVAWISERSGVERQEASRAAGPEPSL